MNLFCLPYAGGSAKVIYHSWQKHLPGDIKVRPLDLPGRGPRIAEPLPDCLSQVIDDLLTQIKHLAHGGPYAIYGHSMGTLLCYELLKAIDSHNLPAPHKVFLAARRPPHLCTRVRNIHLLNDNLLLQEMKKLGGTPQVFFEDPRLLEMFIPILRSDYRMMERYQFDPNIFACNSDIIYFWSDDDKAVNREDAEAWHAYTSGDFVVEEFSGGHFFIHEHAASVCESIAKHMHIESKEPDWYRQSI